MTKLREHFERMQQMCVAFIVPETYIDRDGNSSAVIAGLDGPVRNNLFANDMVYMLDGPEQREAFATDTKVLEDLRDVHAVAMSPGNAHADHYLQGMANGLELAMAIIEGREVAYIESDAVAPQGGFERVLVFHKAFGLPVNELGYVPTVDERLLRGKLLLEEVVEHLCAGLGLTIIDDSGALAGPDQEGGIYNMLKLEHIDGDEYDPVQTLDGLVDIKVIANGTGVAFGLPVEKADRMVFESNMSKLDEDGKPIINGVTPGYTENGQDGLHEPGYRPDLPVGKVLKPATFVAPDIASLL